MSTPFSRKATIPVWIGAFGRRGTTMKNTRLLVTTIAWMAMSTGPSFAQDLSKYRDFQLGTSLTAVAQQAGISPEPRVLQERPALIQELMWQPPRVLASSARADSVRKVLFSFYNGQLFRMVVTYDRERTEGMTAEDFVDAISETYGLPTLPATQLMSASVVPGRSDSPAHWQDSRYSQNLDYDDKVLARWGDSRHSIHLFQSPYQTAFGLVAFSKPLDALARASTVEAARLDAQEAPQREIDRQQKQTDDSRVKKEAARRTNKPIFRF
jgi:hypothetical protein